MNTELKDVVVKLCELNSMIIENNTVATKEHAIS